MNEILRMRSIIRQRIAKRIRELYYARQHYDWECIGEHQSAANELIGLAADLGLITRSQHEILFDAIYPD